MTTPRQSSTRLASCPLQLLGLKLSLDLAELDETLKCTICLGRLRDPVFLKPVRVYRAQLLPDTPSLPACIPFCHTVPSYLIACCRAVASALLFACMQCAHRMCSTCFSNTMTVKRRTTDKDRPEKTVCPKCRSDVASRRSQFPDTSLASFIGKLAMGRKVMAHASGGAAGGGAAGSAGAAVEGATGGYADGMDGGDCCDSDDDDFEALAAKARLKKEGLLPKPAPPAPAPAPAKASKKGKAATAAAAAAPKAAAAPAAAPSAASAGGATAMATDTSPSAGTSAAPAVGAKRGRPSAAAKAAAGDKIAAPTSPASLHKAGGTDMVMEGAVDARHGDADLLTPAEAPAAKRPRPADHGASDAGAGAGVGAGAGAGADGSATKSLPKPLKPAPAAKSPAAKATPAASTSKDTAPATVATAAPRTPALGKSGIGISMPGYSPGSPASASASAAGGAHSRAQLQEADAIVMLQRHPDPSCAWLPPMQQLAMLDNVGAASLGDLVKGLVIQLKEAGREAAAAAAKADTAVADASAGVASAPGGAAAMASSVGGSAASASASASASKYLPRLRHVAPPHIRLFLGVPGSMTAVGPELLWQRPESSALGADGSAAASAAPTAAIRGKGDETSANSDGDTALEVAAGLTAGPVSSLQAHGPLLDIITHQWRQPELPLMLFYRVDEAALARAIKAASKKVKLKAAPAASASATTAAAAGAADTTRSEAAAAVATGSSDAAAAKGAATGTMPSKLSKAAPATAPAGKAVTASK